MSLSTFIGKGRTWQITPRNDMQAYRLTFRLPEMLRGWMFNEPEYTRREALLAKQTYFSDITVYRHDGQRDMLYRLEFSPESVVMGL